MIRVLYKKHSPALPLGVWDTHCRTSGAWWEVGCGFTQILVGLSRFASACHGRCSITGSHTGGPCLFRNRELEMKSLFGAKKKITTLLADMQTFLLPDVLEDIRSPANLRYHARSLLAQNGQKRNWHPLLSARVANRSC